MFASLLFHHSVQIASASAIEIDIFSASSVLMLGGNGGKAPSEEAPGDEAAPSLRPGRPLSKWERAQRSLRAAIAEARGAVDDAALEAAQAQELEEATSAAEAQVASAAKAEAAIEREAAKHATSGRKRLVDWGSALRERQAKAARDSAAAVAAAREKESAVLAAVAAEEAIEAMADAWADGGEEGARECGRWRVETLEAAMVEARAAAEAVADAECEAARAAVAEPLT